LSTWIFNGILGIRPETGQRKNSLLSSLSGLYFPSILLFPAKASDYLAVSHEVIMRHYTENDKLVGLTGDKDLVRVLKVIKFILNFFLKTFLSIFIIFVLK